MSHTDDEDDMWFNTYRRNTYLLLTPTGHSGVIIPMTEDTKLPHRYRPGKGQQFVVNNDLTVTYNGNRLAFMIKYYSYLLISCLIF